MTDGSAPGVSIRRARQADARLLARWRVMEELRRFQPIQSVPEAELRRRLRARERGSLAEERGHDLMWIVEEDGEPVGWVSLTVINWEHHTATMGYSLEPRAWGRGIGTRAVSMLLDLAFGSGRMHRVECTIMVENEASRRLVERLGFTQEGRLRSLVEMPGGRRDFYLYSILREEWAPDRAGTDPGHSKPVLTE